MQGFRFKKVKMAPPIKGYQWFPDGEEQKGVKPLRGKKGYRGSRPCPDCGEFYRDHGWIPDEENGYVVCPGTWVMKYKNDFWPCPVDIFNEIYEYDH